jgi:hypothetical protein
VNSFVLPPSHDPHLNTAVFTCADVLSSVPNLSPKIVAFALQHRSSIHDIFLLIQFATDLASSGDKVGALSLFGNLLRLWTGKLDQTAVLKRCLNFCWLESPEGDPLPTNPSRVGGGSNVTPNYQPTQAETLGAAGDSNPDHVQHSAAGSRQQSGAFDSAALPAKPVYNVPAILEFMQHQRGLRASQFVAILTNLGVSRKQLIQVCKGVLLRHASDSDAVLQGESNAHATPSGMHAPLATPPPANQISSSHGESQTGDLAVDGPKDHSRPSSVAGSTVFNRSQPPRTPIYSNLSSQQGGSRHSFTGVASRGSQSAGGLMHQSSLTQGPFLGDAQEQQCAQVAEALAIVPQLVEMIEEELKEDCAAQVAVVEKAFSVAVGLDLIGDDDGPLARDARDLEPADIDVLQGRAAVAARRKRTERTVAVVSTLGAVLIPGGIGRLLATVPALLVLSRNR